MKSPKFSFVLPQSILDSLESAAKTAGVTRGQYVARVMVNHFRGDIAILRQPGGVAKAERKSEKAKSPRKIPARRKRSA